MPPTLSCRDLVECCWYFWLTEDIALVDGQQVRAWCTNPFDRKGQPWLGGRRDYDMPGGFMVNGGHIAEAGHCAQKRRLRDLSQDVGQAHPHRVSDPRSGTPRRWIVRWRKDPANPFGQVLYSLSADECGDAHATAAARVGQMNEVFVSPHETAEWQRRSPGERKCRACAASRPAP